VAMMVARRLPAVRVSSYSLTVLSVTWLRKSHGVAGLQPLLAQPAGQAVIAVRKRAPPGALRTCRDE
jgi:hypothetical protein